MSNQLKIYCKNIEQYVPITGGETLSDILKRLGGYIPFRPICARVNNKTEDLQYPVFAPKQVEFLTTTSASGSRAYIRSLCMMLYKAVNTLYPQATLRIEHSISRGYYACLHGQEVTPEVVASLRDEMLRLVERDIPFERKERLTKDVIPIFERQGLKDKVKLLQTTRELYTIYYRLDGLCDSYYGVLAPSTGLLRVFDLVPYKEGMLLMGQDPTNPDVPQQPITQEKMYHAFTEHLLFNEVVGVKNVGELNEAVIDRRANLLINVAEAMHDKKIGSIADEIAARYRQGGARFVLIAGPSSSGKTTTTKRLAVQLVCNLLRPQMISLDNYFLDREHTPREANGDYDFESLYALDLDRFNNDLNALLQGQEVELPYYNFELGKREFRGEKVKLEEGSVLLIEGIHGLNPELTSHIEERMKYRIYVSALTTLSIDDHNWVPTTDNRLLRRIIRDYKYRGVTAEDTIKRWPSVRRGEERWIFPYQENADATFNSSLLFELGVMKEYGEEILKHVPRDIPEYGEASRLITFLGNFHQNPAKLVTHTAQLREFMGGCAFRSKKWLNRLFLATRA